MENAKQFKKYNIIKVKCGKSSDKRIESYKIDADSIEILRHLDTKNGWEERKKIVLPTTSKSFCQILEQVNENKSLGMFKPVDIEFLWEKAKLEKKEKREAPYAQLSFLERKKRAIEQIPFDFYYRFRCASEKDCPGHKLQIVDWEIKQAYRDWRRKYRAEGLLLEKIKERWLNRMCSQKNDVYFYVGNMMRFRDQFLVLGVFYPPK